MNDITSAYLAASADGPLATAVADATYPTAFTQAYGHCLLPRPLFIGETEIRRFTSDLSHVFDLIVSLPARLFGGDVHRYCEAAGIPRPVAELVAHDVTGRPLPYLRSDAYHDGSALRLLEINAGSALGGIAYGEMNSALLGIPAFKEFAAEHGLRYTDPADAVAEMLRDAASTVTDARQPVVALLETTGGIGTHPTYRALRQAMTNRGLAFRLGELQQLKFSGGKPTLLGVGVDVVLRYCESYELLAAPAGPAVIGLLRQAHRDGKTVLLTTFEHTLYGAKGALALLSDTRNQESFTAAELRVIERIVPWTRMLVADAALVEHCLRHRERLLLKPSLGGCGRGIVVGGAVSEGEWRDAVSARVGEGYVVQEIVTPTPELVRDPDTGAVADWQANWGVFVTPSGYSGAFIRAQRTGDGTVITLSNGTARSTCVFTYPDGENAGAAPLGEGR